MGPWEPNLLGPRSWRRLPLDGSVDDLAHALKPPLSAAEAALAPCKKASGTPKTHFQLCVIHIFILSFRTIVIGSLGHILSMRYFYFIELTLVMFITFPL
jgi:hypothetical protein